MQIVIDIIDKDYKSITQDYIEYANTTGGRVFKAIKNGIPLPKGHGRLVDYDEMKKIAFDYGRYTESALDYIKPRVLIEADRAESEGEQDV